MNDDEIEASSIKYNISRIVKLSSGRFALFAPWTNGDGMPLVEIGTLADLEDLIPTVEECAAWVESITPVREYETSKINLGAVLGIERPTLIIERRL